MCGGEKAELENDAEALAHRVDLDRVHALPHVPTKVLQFVNIDGASRCRPVKVTFSRPFLRTFAPVRAGAATSQRTAAVPAKAPGAPRFSLSMMFKF